MNFSKDKLSCLNIPTVLGKVERVSVGDVIRSGMWGKLPRTLDIETQQVGFCMRCSPKKNTSPSFFPDILGVCKLDRQRLLSLISRKATSKVPPNYQRLEPRD